MVFSFSVSFISFLRTIFSSNLFFNFSFNLLIILSNIVPSNSLSKWNVISVPSIEFLFFRIATSDFFSFNDSEKSLISILYSSSVKGIFSFDSSLSFFSTSDSFFSVNKFLRFGVSLFAEVSGSTISLLANFDLSVFVALTVSSFSFTSVIFFTSSDFWVFFFIQWTNFN